MKQTTQAREPSLPSVRGLYFGCADSKSIRYDWSEGYAEKWDFYEAMTRDSDDEKEDEDSERDPQFVTNFDGEDRYTFEGPMMSYYYPLPTYDGDPRQGCKLIAHLPLCMIEFMDKDEEERYALALTGGGMNLAWEICEAFMRLGYLPPVHFADLPQMSGRGTSKRDRWIVAGCRRSLQGEKHSAGRSLRRLRENFPAAKDGAK